ncbi:TIGR04104 family putative zinc finger protein [Bacillus massiliigorillae]|uniref:TIGR04104 family putative zinc finger protein n=1 Tax=Bacillus massiliigorillae TaxID=1243664 RepID=UPI000399F02A|nr:TIGR04104 family putative zinc finger protein [Bacillus massiliigorillae]
MTSCQNCNYKWSTKEIWRIGVSKNGRVCAKCGKKQYLSRDTKNWLTVGWLIPLIIILILVPKRFVKLSNKDEPLI